MNARSAGLLLVSVVAAAALVWSQPASGQFNPGDPMGIRPRDAGAWVLTGFDAGRELGSPTNNGNSGSNNPFDGGTLGSPTNNGNTGIYR